MLLLRIDDIVSGTKKASGKEGSQSGAAPTTTPEDWSPVPTQQTNYTSCGPLKMHNSELAHGTLSRRLQFQHWETGFETLDYNLHVRTEWSFCGSWYRCSRTEQSNQYWNLEFRIMSTSKFKAYCWQNGTQNRKRSLLELRTINVNSEQSSGSDHSWFSRRHRVLMLVESLKSTSEAKARGATEGNYSFSSVTQTFLVRYNSIFNQKHESNISNWNHSLEKRSQLCPHPAMSDYDACLRMQSLIDWLCQLL